MANTVSLAIPEEFIHTTRLSADELRTELALHLYEKHKVSLGKASELAMMDKWRFTQLLASRDVPINYDISEFDRDVLTLKEKGLL